MSIKGIFGNCLLDPSFQDKIAESHRLTKRYSSYLRANDDLVHTATSKSFERTTDKTTQSTLIPSGPVSTFSALSSSVPSSEAPETSGLIRLVVSRQMLIGVACTLLVPFLLLAFTVVLKKKSRQLIRWHRARERRIPSANEADSDEQTDPIYDEVGSARNRSSSIGTRPYAISPLLPPRVSHFCTLPTRRSGKFKLRSPRRGRAHESQANMSTSISPTLSSTSNLLSGRRFGKGNDIVRRIKENSFYFNLNEHNRESERTVYADINSSVFTKDQCCVTSVSDTDSTYVQPDSRHPRNGRQTEEIFTSSTISKDQNILFCDTYINPLANNNNGTYGDHIETTIVDGTPNFINKTPRKIQEDDCYVWPDQALGAFENKPSQTSCQSLQPQKQPTNQETYSQNISSRIIDSTKSGNCQITTPSSVCTILTPQIRQTQSHETAIELKTFGKCLNSFTKRQEGNHSTGSLHITSQKV